MIDLYKQQLRLESFKRLNYTACVKILKKHDKANTDRPLSAKVLRLLEDEPLQTMASLDELKNELEIFFAQEFCDGNRAIAKTQLLLKQNVAGYWQLFQLGVRTGCAVVLLVWCLWDCVVDQTDNNLWLNPVMSTYKFCGSLLLLVWCWGVAVYVFNRVRINYIYIFEFKPQDCLSY
eukprot:g394.t1